MVITHSTSTCSSNIYKFLNVVILSTSFLHFLNRLFFPALELFQNCLCLQRHGLPISPSLLPCIFNFVIFLTLHPVSFICITIQFHVSSRQAPYALSPKYLNHTITLTIKDYNVLTGYRNNWILFHKHTVFVQMLQV